MRRWLSLCALGLCVGSLAGRGSWVVVVTATIGLAALLVYIEETRR